jgi:MFS family permease
MLHAPQVAAERRPIPWQLRAPSTLGLATLSLLGATGPGVERAFGLGSGALAVAFAAQTTGALLGALAVGALRHPLLRGRPAALMTAVLLLAAGAAPSFALLALAMLGAGAACFVVNVRAQADVSRLAGTARSRELLRFHVWGGGGGFAFPLLVAGLLALGLSWRAGYWLLAAPFAAYAVVAAPSLEAEHPPRNSGGRPRLSRRARFAVASASSGVAIQVTIPLFLATLLVHEFGTSEAAGSAAVSAYALGLFASRAAGLRLLPRCGPDRLLGSLAAIALAAYVPLALAGSAVSVAAAALLLGVGIGPVMPLAMARAATLIGDDRYASSLVFTLNGAAQMALPAAVAAGLLVTSLQTALAATAALAAFLAVAVRLSAPSASGR